MVVPLEVLVEAPPFVLVLVGLSMHRAGCAWRGALVEDEGHRERALSGFARRSRPAEHSTLVSVARPELHCRWGAVGS